jgi:hypothetical protein
MGLDAVGVSDSLSVFLYSHSIEGRIAPVSRMARPSDSAIPLLTGRPYTNEFANRNDSHLLCFYLTLP